MAGQNPHHRPESLAAAPLKTTGRRARLALITASAALILAGQSWLLFADRILLRLAELTLLPGEAVLRGAQAGALPGLLLLAGGLLLILPVLSGTRGGEGFSGPAPVTPAQSAALVVILLFATFLRLYRWQEIPPGVNVDEAINGLNALGIAVRGRHTIFFENSDGREILLPYLVAGAVKPLGLSLFAFRMAPLAVALVTVSLVFALGREIFDNQVGLLAALLMAASKWHLLISRVTHEAVPVPLLATASVLFFVRALRRRRLVDYVLCGVCLGLGMYTYPAFRSMPILLLIACAYFALAQRAFVREQAARLFVAAGTAVVVFAPFAQYMLDRWPQFAQRMRVTSFYMDPHYSGDAVGTLWANTLTSLSLFFAKNSAVFYLPGDAVLDFMSAAAAILGLLFCLRYGLSRHYILLPAWFAIGLLPSILSHAVRLPHALRAASVIPLTPLLAAAGLAWLIRALPAGRAVRATVLSFTVAAIVFLNLQTYFVTYANSAAVYQAFDPVPSEAARAVNELSPRYQVFVSPLIAEHATFRFLTYGHSAYRRLNPANLVGIAGTLESDIACVISPFDVSRYEDLLSRLQAAFPRGVLATHLSPNGGHVYSTFLIDRADLPVLENSDLSADWGRAATGAPILHAAARTGSETGLLGWYYQDSLEGPMALGEPRLVRVDVGADIGDWRAANYPFTVVWRGTIAIAEPGGYRFDVAAQGAARLSVDDQVVTEFAGGAATAPVDGSIALAAGDHPIEIRYVFATGKPGLTVHWTRPDGVTEVLPGGVLTPAVAMDRPPCVWGDLF